MNRLMTHITAITAIVLCFASCDTQRDLYTAASPLLYIEGDWVPSLNKEDMSQNATAMIYSNDILTDKEYFQAPKSVTASLDGGEYDVIIFNGLMYSPDNTHLDDVLFRGADNPKTFEGYGVEAVSNKRLAIRNGEYIISNDMEILTSGHSKVAMEGMEGYYVKYRNGVNGFPTFENYIESSINITPFALSYYTKIIVTLINPSSAAVANGALRGFSGSVYMNSRMPSHFEVTHQFKLNSLKITNPGTKGDPTDPETGTIESPQFVTFGPPLDMPEKKYELEVSIILKDNSTLNRIIDITDQIIPVIDQIRINLKQQEPVQIDIEIPIDVEVALPDIDVETGGVGVGDWDEDEIIKVPIHE